MSSRINHDAKIKLIFKPEVYPRKCKYCPKILKSIEQEERHFKLNHTGK